MEKSNLMMIVIIVLLVALLGTVVGVTFFAFNMVRTMEAQVLEGGFDGTQRPVRPDQINHVMIGEPITTNLATGAGTISNHMARVQLVVGYDNTQGRESDNIAALIDSQMTYLRMVALDSIANRTFAELTTQGGRDALTAELLEAFQNDFQTNMIVSVGFYEWLIS